MIASAALTADLRREVLRLEDDLRDRLAGDAVTESSWRSEHAAAVSAGRTAASWVAWRDDRVTQAAVGWVLGCVFVRFCEDNALVAPVWFTGPGARRGEATDGQLMFFRSHPLASDRDFLESAFGYLSSLPATAGLVGEHSAIRLIGPSGAAASGLVELFRARGDDGGLRHDFTDPGLDTRFLGDLYQELSEHAKATFALLQTPVFVEEFILDRTLEPALAERPLAGFRVIDPTCGSGHFLLGAFHRLLGRWRAAEPGAEPAWLVQQALGSVFGVDLNPFAVAIARFRLTVAALQACGLSSLEAAPGFGVHLAVGDSLLHGRTGDALDLGRGFDPDVALAGLSGFAYSTEDLDLLDEYLAEGRYDAVVGNPPYITVKDKALNAAYRERYDACKGTYAMTVPFLQRFFALAKPGGGGQPAGWVGQITSNSFMKREFGSKLIETVLARLDLRLVADTSGAFIPGHGTPTVILVGRNQPPVGASVRAVLGVCGEPGVPEDPAKGIVWTAITEHVDQPGWDDNWVTVTDLDRSALATHPWSLTGGGASELVATLTFDRPALDSRIHGKIGFASFPGADDVFFAPRHALARDGVPQDLLRPVILGEAVRDWDTDPQTWALTPYDENAALVPFAPGSAWARRLWPLRTVLRNVTGFGGQTQEAAGADWWGWYRWVAERYRTPLSITFAFVATHNHFVLDRGGMVFKQSAPVIKLPEGAGEDEHLALLGVLNSSTACFWLKQNSHNKGRPGAESAGADEPWEHRFEFTGTTLQEFPLATSLPLTRARLLDALAQQYSACQPSVIMTAGIPTATRLAEARKRSEHVRAQMVAIQEELDWEVYRAYGLTAEDLTYRPLDAEETAGEASGLPGLEPGERAFAITLARDIEAGRTSTTWFTHHNHKHTPITEPPARWPTAYAAMVQRRIEVASTIPGIGLLERPEHKRRWATEPWEKSQERALRGWLLDRLEHRDLWFDRQGRPTPRSIASLADDVARYPEMVSVLDLWAGRRDAPVAETLTRLLADEAVPYLAAYRLTETGLRKRQAWEHTWELQRAEDRGEPVGVIPVPPKYVSTDVRRPAIWAHRGKLDVPKERFIAYPGANRDTDPTPLLGWAGWDHAQQALALNVIIAAREADGWTDTALIPLVAGLAELQPWVDQWHSDVDPAYGVSLAAFCAEQLTTRASQVGCTLDQLAAWRPPAPTRGRRPRTTRP